MFVGTIPYLCHFLSLSIDGHLFRVFGSSAPIFGRWLSSLYSFHGI